MVNIVKSLIKEGADVNLADWSSKTPLHCAAAAGFGEIAKILVEAKAAENLAEDIKEDEMAAFLKACATERFPPRLQ